MTTCKQIEALVNTLRVRAYTNGWLAGEQRPMAERDPALKDTVAAEADVIAALRDLAEDAERYRWLRAASVSDRVMVQTFEFPRATWEQVSGSELDAAIDAARAASAGDSHHE